MNHRLSLTEYVLLIVILFALANGAAKIYEHGLNIVNEATAERIRQAGE